MERTKRFFDCFTVLKRKIAGATSKDLKKILGRRTINDIINMETGEVMLEAGSKINEDNISILKEMKVKEVELIEFPKGKTIRF